MGTKNPSRARKAMKPVSFRVPQLRSPPPALIPRAFFSRFGTRWIETLRSCDRVATGPECADSEVEPRPNPRNHGTTCDQPRSAATEAARSPFIRRAQRVCQQRLAWREERARAHASAQRLTNSTRRLRVRPASVAFDSLGLLSPKPLALRFDESTPRRVSAASTASARCCDNL